MKDKIRKHVNTLFEDTPNTKRVFDLKEELITNLNEKYDDLVKEGKTEEEAYENVIAGIGDVDELVSSIEQSSPIKQQINEQRRKKNALMVSIAVGLYILSIVSCIILDEIGVADYISAVSLFIIGGAATCLLIYHFMSQPKYTKEDDTIVEEFKEWKSNKINNKEVQSAVNSILWLLIVTIYFLISFIFQAWAYSWIIFLIGAAISNMVRLYFKIKE